MKNLLRSELIGLEVEIKDSKNRCNIGIKGRIIDETKNMLTIETKKGEKKLLKNQNRFVFKINKKRIAVDGKLLHGRPEERIKG